MTSADMPFDVWLAKHRLLGHRVTGSPYTRSYWFCHSCPRPQDDAGLAMHKTFGSWWYWYWREKMEDE